MVWRRKHRVASLPIVGAEANTCAPWGGAWGSTFFHFFRVAREKRVSTFSFSYGIFFASRGMEAPWPLGLVGCLHVSWGTVHPHAYFYLLFLIRHEMAKGGKCQETVFFLFLLWHFEEVERVKKRASVWAQVACKKKITFLVIAIAVAIWYFRI